VKTKINVRRKANSRGAVCRSVLMLAAIPAVAAGCGGGDADAPADGGAVTFAPQLQVELDQMEEGEGGLRYRDLEEGTGAEVSAGQTATVHYTGWLPSGEEFDSSRGSAPFEFTVGAGEVIAGWDQGVAGMRVGGRRQLVIPPQLGYGSTGAGGVIPPNATLVFEVELLGVN